MKKIRLLSVLFIIALVGMVILGSSCSSPWKLHAVKCDAYSDFKCPSGDPAKHHTFAKSMAKH